MSKSHNADQYEALALRIQQQGFKTQVLKRKGVVVINEGYDTKKKKVVVTERIGVTTYEEFETWRRSNPHNSESAKAG